jgi:large subunit ribosomal protein L25
MKESFVVSAEVRADQGKGASRRLRRTGKVPAILYGGKAEPQKLLVTQHEMAKHLETEAFYSHILTLKVQGQEHQAVLKDIQRHPAKPIFMHFDFQRVFADVAIRMQVPLHFKGEEHAPGVKTGGAIIEHHLIQVEVECLPGQLPEFIEVDLSGLEINDAIHLSQLQLPQGVALVELKHGKDPSVAACHMPRAVVEVEAAPEAVPAEVPAIAQKAEGETEAKTGDGKPESAKPEKKEEKKK